MRAPPVRRPALWGPRTILLVTALLAGLLSIRTLDLSLDDLIPSEGGGKVTLNFFSRALSPAWHSEADFVPPGTPSLLWLALQAAGQTLLFATTSMGLAVVLGLVLGFFSSTAWWAEDLYGGRNRWIRILRHTLCPVLYLASRITIAILRSIHELLWAVLFLASIGLTPMAAVLAIALPFAGVLAKIYSEMVDEVPRSTGHALRTAGASASQVYLFGFVTQALPDMVAYTLYRFECAVRSSAVLGFFGFPTLGLYIRQSSMSLNHGETWTFLYVLILLIFLLESWSAAVRRRLRR